MANFTVGIPSKVHNVVSQLHGVRTEALKRRNLVRRDVVMERLAL